MSQSALVMMLVAMLLVWGGLLMALWHLWRHPEVDDES